MTLRRYWAFFILITYVLGLGSGFLVWERDLFGLKSDPAIGETHQQDMSEIASLVSQINPNEGYVLPTRYGDIGPRLLEAGAIDFESFLQVYLQSGQPLSSEQISILERGSDAQIVIGRENARFLLNMFWALGLVNQNSLLTEGPMIEYSQGVIGNYASTGGWTIGAKPATELYASTEIISLTPEQHEHVEEVARNVYRPCCNNPTHFPDCNHGMAMFGLLQLMASQGATVEEMFVAAKYVNAFWFPQQTLELAMAFKAAQGLDFPDIDARELVGPSFSSGSGFQAVHEWLVANGLLEQAPRGGSSCGV
jgi:hypothetical protein